MPSEKQQKKNREKTLEHMKDIPPAVPGSSAGIFSMVLRRLTESEEARKKKAKK
jgi:hypothetical protein